MIRVTNKNINSLLNKKKKNKKKNIYFSVLESLLLLKNFKFYKKTKGFKKHKQDKQFKALFNLNYYLILNKFFYLKKSFYNIDFNFIKNQKINYLIDYKYLNLYNFSKFLYKLKILIDNDLITYFLKNINFFKMCKNIELNLLPWSQNLNINKLFFLNNKWMKQSNLVGNYKLSTINLDSEIEQLKKKESMIYEMSPSERFFFPFNKRKKNIRIFIRKLCSGSGRALINKYSKKVKKFMQKYKVKQIFFSHFYYTWRLNSYKKKKFVYKFPKIENAIQEDKTYILRSNYRLNTLSMLRILRNYNNKTYFGILYKNKFDARTKKESKHLFVYKNLFLFFCKNKDNKLFFFKKQQSLNYLYSNSSFFLKKFLIKNKKYKFYKFFKKKLKIIKFSKKKKRKKKIKIKNIHRILKNNKFGFFLQKFIKNKNWKFRHFKNKRIGVKNLNWFRFKKKKEKKTNNISLNLELKHFQNKNDNNNKIIKVKCKRFKNKKNAMTNDTNLNLKFLENKNKNNIKIKIKKKIKRLKKNKKIILYKFFKNKKYLYKNFIDNSTIKNLRFLYNSFNNLKKLKINYRYIYKYKQKFANYFVKKNNLDTFLKIFTKNNKTHFNYNYFKSLKRFFFINIYKNKTKYYFFQNKKNKLKTWKKKNIKLTKFNTKKISFYLLRKRKYIAKFTKKKMYIFINDYHKKLLNDLKKKSTFKYNLYEFFKYKINNYKRYCLYNFDLKKNTQFKNLFIKNKNFNNSPTFYLNHKLELKKEFELKKNLFNFFISNLLLKNEFKKKNNYYIFLNVYNYFNKLNLLKKKINDYNSNLIYNRELNSDIVDDLGIKLNLINSFEKEVKVNTEEFNRSFFYKFAFVAKSIRSLEKRAEAEKKKREKEPRTWMDEYFDINGAVIEDLKFFSIKNKNNKLHKNCTAAANSILTGYLYGYEETVLFYGGDEINSRKKNRSNLNFHEKKLSSLIFHKTFDIAKLKTKRPKKLKKFDIK